jgi:hypothetical protein
MSQPDPTKMITDQSSTKEERSWRIPKFSRGEIVADAPKPALTDENLDVVLRQRIALYKCAALDALYDLAMMPLSSNSAQNQVKYLAACRLAGPAAEATPVGANGMDELLKRLDNDYRENAPKIARVRERIIEFETEPKAIEADSASSAP